MTSYFQILAYSVPVICFFILFSAVVTCIVQTFLLSNIIITHRVSVRDIALDLTFSKVRIEVGSREIFIAGDLKPEICKISA
jgi:hypothetical protein